MSLAQKFADAKEPVSDKIFVPDYFYSLISNVVLIVFIFVNFLL